MMVDVTSEDTTLILTLSPDAMVVLEQAAESSEMSSVDALLHSLLSDYCQTDGINVEFGGHPGRRSLESGRLAVVAEIHNDKLWVTLADETVIATPLYWYPFLTNATHEQQSNFTVDGTSIFWPDLQDSVSVEGIIQGPSENIKAIIAARDENNPNLLLPGF
jgi:hypothetical protein